jgi:multidrug efflux system membrane fusion protein
MEEMKAHFLPASAILLNDQGATIAKILRDDVVDSVEVSILGEEKEGLWVAGLPFESLVITVGQNYVVDGDLVNIEISNR